MYTHACRDIFSLRDGFGILYEIRLNAAAGNPRLCCCPGQSLVSRGPSLVAGSARGALCSTHPTARPHAFLSQHRSTWIFGGEGGGNNLPRRSSPQNAIPRAGAPPAAPTLYSRGCGAAAAPRAPLPTQRMLGTHRHRRCAPTSAAKPPPGTGMGLVGGSGQGSCPPPGHPRFSGGHCWWWAAPG